MFTTTQPGTRVRIVRDVRDGAPADGQIGVYEGDFPIAAVVCRGDTVEHYDYDAFMAHNAQQPPDARIPHMHELLDANPTILFEEWRAAHPDQAYWWPHENPRIRLADGSVIWGAECWWDVVEADNPPLDEANRQLDEFLDGMRQVLRAARTEEDTRT